MVYNLCYLLNVLAIFFSREGIMIDYGCVKIWSCPRTRKLSLAPMTQPLSFGTLDMVISLLLITFNIYLIPFS